MSENKKSFVLYTDSYGLIKQLPNETAGRLFKHIFAYINDENPVSEDLLLNIAFESIKQHLKRDLLKYENKKQQWSEAGKKSAEQRALNKSNELQRNPTNVKSVATVSTVSVIDSVNVSVSDSVIVSDSVNDILLKKESKKDIFKKPTLDDCKTLFLNKTAFNWTEKFALSEATIFFNFYESKDWFVGKNKMKSLSGAIGGWIARSEKTETEKGSQTKKGNSTADLISNYGKITPIF